ncbi:antibiotic biosynthesis monooxygenase family protein [Streptomyces sp. NPDC028635]|uniref:antibiotic biosynthesis monooxygenase family protein n=1 Tax=Streptomyces sp. NPDC028635 TaxID=3154800 RepID=UPI0033E5475A
MITFINRFTVTGPPEEFERAFERTSAFFGTRPGFVRHRLLKHADDPATYVNVAEWQDRDSFEQAVRHPDFAAHRAALRALSTGEPGIYTVHYERVA